MVADIAVAAGRRVRHKEQWQKLRAEVEVFGIGMWVAVAVAVAAVRAALGTGLLGMVLGRRVGVSEEQTAVDH